MDPPQRDRPSFTVRVGTGSVVVRQGTNLRKALLKAGLTPYGRGAHWLNCHGFGTCGTCAVEVDGALSQPTRRERGRLGFPPHDQAAGLRLACQCRVEGDLVVQKHAGFWGQRIDATERPVVEASQ
ncbi:MAG: ferredoxin [Myxococcota bacterium]|jgi:ferredoxin